jgi:hypothetical protein
MAEDSRKSISSVDADPGPFLAKVISNNDPTYMGGLEVQVLREVGGEVDSAGTLTPVKYLNPFYGVTGIDHIGRDPDDYNNTQKSHGMWFVPPDVGSIVIVFFIQGDPKRGYWIGCVQEENMNFMIPGYAATKFKVSGDEERVPVAEYNKVIRGSTLDPTKILKPQHPFAKILKDQGLLKDDARGITTSSARRESPSSVFGISTPGPVDKQNGAKKGSIGKKEHKIANAYVSRLGGSSFVMDDGDDKFIRKGSPSTTPAEYASLEQGQTGGDVTRPHNELIRLRTRTGHQILLHNSEDLIYIGNARGTSWVELSSDGKIDIYAEDSISVHTKQDMNFYADRDINLQAGRNFNVKAGNEFQAESVKNLNLIIGANGKITTTSNLDINSGGTHTETASQIHMNGPTAAKAVPLKTHVLPTEVDGQTVDGLIMRRMPTHEPYPQHENLDPQKYKPAATNRDVDGRTSGSSTSIKAPASQWKKYSHITDTFEKLKGSGG